MDFLKFFMVCVIVVYHIGAVGEPLHWIDHQLDRVLFGLINNLAVLAMRFFFLTTGFLLFYNLNLKNLGEKIRKRIHSLMIPYVSWQLISGLYQLLQGSRVSMGSFISRVFLMQDYPLNGALWYVYVVFLFALCSPVLLWIFRSKTAGFLLTMSAAVVSAAIPHTVSPEAVPVLYEGFIPNIICYLPSYLFGAYFGHFSQGKMGMEEIRTYALALGGAFLCNSAVDGVLGEVLSGMLPILLLCFLPVPGCLQDRKIYKVSFFLFAIHTFTLNGPFAVLVHRIMNGLPVFQFLRRILTQGLIFAWSLLCAGALYWVLKKYWPRALKILTGGR